MQLSDTPVLVSGADGFIGSHLVEQLLAAGANVRALVHYNAFHQYGWLDELPEHPRLEIVTGDIRDQALCGELVRGQQFIFHLAALIGIPYSYRASESYVATNVQGTLNLCQAALQAGCQRFVHTSTSEVYGTALYVPIDEAHPLQPQSPYSASKIGADAIAMSYYHSFGLPLIIARPFNTFGPRQSARAIIPTIISQLAAGQRELRLGDLRPTRDLTFVHDTCQAFLMLATCEPAVGQAVNICTGLEHRMEEVVGQLQTLMGSEALVVEDPQRLRPAPSEVMRLCGDPTRLQELTGWQPQYDLNQGLRATIAWFTEKPRTQHYKPNRYHV